MWTIRITGTIIGCVCLCQGATCASEDTPAGGMTASTTGKFGLAFLPSDHGLVQAEAAGRPEYLGPPLTVEFWGKVWSKNQFNIFLAYAPKESPAHWELYTYIGTGNFSVYLPGASPSEIQSGRDITDGLWHYLAFVFEADRVCLYVDGERVVEQPISLSPDRSKSIPEAKLTFGRLVSFQGPPLACDGAIDEVRISKVARTIVGAPAAPLGPDEHTVGLWSFDETSGAKVFADMSKRRNDVDVRYTPRRSLDEIDLASYDPLPGPMDGSALEVTLKPGAAVHPEGHIVLDLAGTWQMAEGGTEKERLGSEWGDAIQAEVPGSVHVALVKVGRIPDPTVGLNDARAREQSFKTWWFERTFENPEGLELCLLYTSDAADE